MTGRLTLGLYNSYDPQHFHEAMRRAIARAAPLAAAFDLNLALFGFPFHAYRTSQGETPQPKTPQELAVLVADSTTIGDGGRYLLELARAGRFQSYPYPDPGFPPQLGISVLATETPDTGRFLHMETLARRLLEGQSFVVLFGLGPRGIPTKIQSKFLHHLELTGNGRSLETATALGVFAGQFSSAVRHAYAQAAPRLTVDALVVKAGNLLLVKRSRDPFRGDWALPGGFVDPGETCQEAVLRELREETGLQGRRPVFFGIYDDPKRDPRFPTVTHVYVVEADGNPQAGDDASEAQFFLLNRLPPLAFDHSKIVTDYQTKRSSLP